MIYLISQVLVLLAIASLLSAIVGWLIRWRKAQQTEEVLRKRLGMSEQVLPSVRNALADANDELDRQDTDLMAMHQKLKDYQASMAAEAENFRQQTLTLEQQGRDAEARSAAELADLQAQLQANDKLLADAMSVAGEQSEKIDSMGASDADLRERIAELEQLLSDERRLHGRDQLARIIELEAMLEAERINVEKFSSFDEIVEVEVTTRASNESVETELTPKKNAGGQR